MSDKTQFYYNPERLKELAVSIKNDDIEKQIAKIALGVVADIAQLVHNLGQSCDRVRRGGFGLYVEKFHHHMAVAQDDLSDFESDLERASRILNSGSMTQRLDDLIAEIRRNPEGFRSPPPPSVDRES